MPYTVKLASDISLLLLSRAQIRWALPSMKRITFADRNLLIKEHEQPLNIHANTVQGFLWSGGAVLFENRETLDLHKPGKGRQAPVSAAVKQRTAS